MNKKDFEEIERICEAERTKAHQKLDEEWTLSHGDQQYWIGINHAAKDILHNIRIYYGSQKVINEGVMMNECNIVSTPSSELTFSFPTWMFYHLIGVIENADLKDFENYIGSVQTNIDNFIEKNGFEKCKPIYLNIENRIFEVQVRKKNMTE